MNKLQQKMARYGNLINDVMGRVEELQDKMSPQFEELRKALMMTSALISTLCTTKKFVRASLRARLNMAHFLASLKMRTHLLATLATTSC